MHIREISDVFKSDNKNLSYLRKKSGKKQTLALLKLYLIDINELLNLRNPLTERMIDEIAETILNDYFFLTIADIYLIFKRIKTGHYGEFYGSINMPKVCQVFYDYSNERLDLAAQQSASQIMYEGERTVFNGLTKLQEFTQRKINEKTKNSLPNSLPAGI